MHQSTSHLHFHKSSYSSAKGQDCVEVADLPEGGAAIRDTQHREVGHLSFPVSEWATLLGTARRQA
ncbi:DUF397 domain-containing protein [Nocardiopsis flavescens]